MANESTGIDTNLAVLCDVILSDWLAQGQEGFEIRAFRYELLMHYKSAGLEVPPEIADPGRLVPARRHPIALPGGRDAHRQTADLADESIFPWDRRLVAPISVAKVLSPRRRRRCLAIG